jgi:hypothetical protein
MSKGGDRKDMATVPTSAVQGNPLFERAVVAVGLDDNTTRWLLVSVLKTLAVAPEKLSPDDLGNLLPEIDRRLRKLTKDDQADAAMKRLYRLLFEQADG